MRHFDYKDGEMFAEDVSLREIAAKVGTPAYVYSSATFKRHFQVFSDAFKGRKALIAYSVKANSNIAVLATLARLGAGADVVSEGELVRALTAGIPASKIVFSGVGKTEGEMRAALTAGIRVFNVESLPELERLSDVALSMNTRAPVAFRVNPDVSAGGHEKISTGKAENKFGIAWSSVETAYARAGALKGIEIVGVDMHIGSQIDSLAPFEAAIEKVGGLIAKLRAQGHTIKSFDIGGGLGIPYGDNTKTPPPPSSEVVYAKSGEDREFLIIDAAMNDLIRPALYEAYHEIEPVRAPGRNFNTQTYDVVGPICESGDTFTKRRELPELSAGDLIVLHSAGAYGASQSSQYNTRPLVPEVLVSGDKFTVVRERPKLEDILRTETIPDWV